MLENTFRGRPAKREGFINRDMLPECVKPDCCLTGLSSAIACSSELDPGLLGKAFGCRFLQSAKGYSSENSLSGRESILWILKLFSE